MDISWNYRHNLPFKYVSPFDCLLLLEACEQLGATAAIIFGALVPAATLVLQKVGPLTNWFQKNDTSCGVATYMIVALAMIIGSLLKPQSQGPAKGNER